MKTDSAHDIRYTLVKHKLWTYKFSFTPKYKTPTENTTEKSVINVRTSSND